MISLIALQFASVLAHVGIASGYPQLRALYGSAVLASSFLAAVPLAAMAFGFIWGPISRRFGLRRALVAAVCGWSLSSLALALFASSPAAGIGLRAVHGVFDIAFASLPLAAATRRLGHGRERRRFFGRFETAASVGAIVGPLTVGNLMLVSVRGAFLALAAFAPIYLAFALRVMPGDEGAGATTEGAGATTEGAGATTEGAGARPRAAGANEGTGRHGRHPAIPRRGFPRAMIAPSLYAVGVLVLISASEAFLPGFIEDVTRPAWLGKLGVAVYEVLVIAGVTLKSRLEGTRTWVPLGTAAVFLVAFATSGLSTAVLILLAVSAVGIGMSLTMSHEFAAYMAAEDAEGRMTAYASVRISGGVLGPYVAALGLPVLFLPLAAISLVSAPLLHAGLRTTSPRKELGEAHRL